RFTKDSGFGHSTAFSGPFNVLQPLQGLNHIDVVDWMKPSLPISGRTPIGGPLLSTKT
ncbi:Hypothetical protein FKW44_012422, partial [Caligus rogercresseyi]